mgnify:CR=1 FL=1
MYAKIWMVIVYGECWVNVGVKGCKKKFITLPCILLCVTIYNFCMRLFEDKLKHYCCFTYLSTKHALVLVWIWMTMCPLLSCVRTDLNCLTCCPGNSLPVPIVPRVSPTYHYNIPCLVTCAVHKYRNCLVVYVAV